MEELWKANGMPGLRKDFASLTNSNGEGFGMFLFASIQQSMYQTGVDEETVGKMMESGELWR